MAKYNGKEIELFKSIPLIDKRIIIKDTKELIILKRGCLHVCEICGQEFKSGSREKATFICSKHSFWIEYCDVCNKEYELTYDKMKIDGDILYCSYSCYYKLNSGPGECRKCGQFVQERPLNKMCKKCTIEFNNKLSENNSKADNCTKCGKYSEIRSGAGICNECTSKFGKEISKKLMKSGNCTKCGNYSEKRSASGLCIKCANINSKPGVCKRCDKFSEHRNNAGLCSQCSKLLGLKTVEINTKPGNCTKCGNYSDKRDQSGMCKECRYKVSSSVGIYNVKNKTIAGICIKCGKFVEHRNVSGTCFKCGKVGIFNFLPEKLQPCGHTSKSVLSNNKYECWECYKNNFNKIDKKPSFNGIMIPTFIKQNSNKKIPVGKFEEYLKDLNVNWFVYIKFHENGKPLVIGTSGSILVNKNGSDLCFDKNLDGGPARQLLIETNTNWDKEEIEIIKCENKDEAFKLELYLQLKYCVFGS